MKTYLGVMNLAKRMKNPYASLAMDRFLKTREMISRAACDATNRPAACIIYSKCTASSRYVVHMAVGNLFMLTGLLTELETLGAVGSIALLPEQVELADALRSRGMRCTGWMREHHPEVMIFGGK